METEIGRSTRQERRWDRRRIGNGSGNVTAEMGYRGGGVGANVNGNGGKGKDGDGGGPIDEGRDGGDTEELDTEMEVDSGTETVKEVEVRTGNKPDR